MNPKTANGIGKTLALFTWVAIFLLCCAIGCGIIYALTGCATLPEDPVSATFTVTASQSGITIAPGSASAPPADDSLSGSAETESPSIESPSATPSGSADDPSPQTNQAAEASPDGVAFSSLSWRFGGFNGAGAALSTPRIASLSAKASGLSFKWQTGLSSWGLANDDASAIAALFVQTPDASWIGGKFDWISTSRSTRDFKNIYSGYNGWSLSGLENPCPACFVVVSKDGKKRSNVLGPVSWKHD